MFMSIGLLLGSPSEKHPWSPLYHQHQSVGMAVQVTISNKPLASAWQPDRLSLAFRPRLLGLRVEGKGDMGAADEIASLASL